MASDINDFTVYCGYNSTWYQGNQSDIQIVDTPAPLQGTYHLRTYRVTVEHLLVVMAPVELASSSGRIVVDINVTSATADNGVAICLPTNLATGTQTGVIIRVTSSALRVERFSVNTVTYVSGSNHGETTINNWFKLDVTWVRTDTSVNIVAKLLNSSDEEVHSLVVNSVLCSAQDCFGLWNTSLKEVGRFDYFRFYDNS
jgi:hypothetical protein